MISVLGACTPKDRQPPFLVLDIVSVARALGRDAIIQQKLEEANGLLNSQLAQISSSLQQQLKDEQEKLDVAKNKSDREKLNELTLQVQVKLKQSQLLAQQKADQYRSKLLLDFRQEVLAVAKKLAEKRDVFSIQIVDNDLLWYRPSIDITADVIKVLRASEKKAEAENESKVEKKSENSAQIDELNLLIDTIEKENQADSTEQEKNTATDENVAN